MGSSVQQLELLSTKFKIRYNVSEHRFQSGTSGEQVFLESRDISYGRASGIDNVLLWDCVDEDASYPLKKTTAVTRSTVGALLVRAERCDDGIDRVICRYICTKIHRMHSAELSPDIKRFSHSSQLGAKVADSMVYEAVKGIASLSTL
ncbi:THO complex subunit 5 B [Phytophthora cinnamomi]|uniref:THO complex subunit 5 B n=1 Tax=Phytophthora cinnamomi TaxID=4785 RepID=UPI003559976C|nr:THO complex subunit 5 B [Phytophthora cinnamomi]